MPPAHTREIAERLLALYPADAIHETDYVGEPMTKDEAIGLIIDRAEGDVILQFAAANFGLLHQHVYVFEHDGADSLNVDGLFDESPFEQETKGDETHYYYLLERTYRLVLDSPLEHDELTFAWPVKIVTAPGHIRVHFTIMAKSPTAYVDESRTVVKSTPHPTEDVLLQEFEASPSVPGNLRRMDLNKGIKALWDADRFDAPVVQYKRAKATSKDVMDEDFTVKRDDPALYRELWDKPLFNTVFRFPDDEPCIRYFVIDPTKGSVTFRRYSSSNDCVDDVVRDIVEAN